MSQGSSYVAWNGSEYSGFPHDYSSELDIQENDQYFANGTTGQYDQPGQGSPSSYGYARDCINDRDDLQEAFVRGNTNAESTSTAKRVSRVSKVSRDVDDAFAENASTKIDRDLRKQKPRRSRTDGGGSGSKKKKDKKNAGEMIALDEDGYDKDNEEYNTQHFVQNEYYYGQEHSGKGGEARRQ